MSYYITLYYIYTIISCVYVQRYGIYIYTYKKQKAGTHEANTEANNSPTKESTHPIVSKADDSPEYVLIGSYLTIPLWRKKLNSGNLT